VARVLLTGMSGAGKSTVLDELHRRGHLTVDTDDGWHLPDGTWDEARMSDLLAAQPSLVVAGTAENQGRFYDRFAHVVLLSAPIDVLLDRVRRRTNNPYGKAPAEQQDIRRYVAEVEPLLRRGSTLELDARLPVAALADALEVLLSSPA
jgi:shikimate kinase